MANTAQAKKRARQAEKHRQHNVSSRSMLRSSMKKVTKAIEEANKAEAVTAFAAAQPLLDRMARKGIIHKNKAARHKSRYQQLINQLT